MKIVWEGKIDDTPDKYRLVILDNVVDRGVVKERCCHTFIWCEDMFGNTYWDDTDLPSSIITKVHIAALMQLPEISPQ